MRVVVLSMLSAAGCLAAPLETRVLIGAPVRGEPEADVSRGEFSSPFGIAFGKGGGAFVVELGGGRVWAITDSPDATAVARQIAGKATEKSYLGDGGPAAEATFNGMHNCVVAADGDLLISDTWNHCVRRIDSDSGVISTFAGAGKPGFAGDGGRAREARFHDLISISLDPAKETLYVADIRNRRIRAIDMGTEIVRTVAGNGEKGVPADGSEAAASPLVDPRAIAADARGNLWILERGGHALRLVTPDGKIQTAAGNGKRGYRDGPALEAQLAGPKHLCLDDRGRVLIADEQNAAIRVFDPESETLATILGRGVGKPARKLSRPHGVTFHGGKLYIVDSGNNRILVER